MAVAVRSRQRRREQVYLYMLTFALLSGTVTGLALLTRSAYHKNKEPIASLPQVLDIDTSATPVTTKLAEIVPDQATPTIPASPHSSSVGTTQEIGQQTSQLVDTMAIKLRRQYVHDLLTMSQKLMKIQDLISKLPQSQYTEHDTIRRELQQLDREAAHSMTMLKLHRGAQTATHTAMMTDIAAQSEQQYMIHYQVLMDIGIFTSSVVTDEHKIRIAKQDLSQANEFGIASFRKSDELFR